MSRPLLFRAWTGRTMMYQDNQYLGSFIRRVVTRIMLENGSGEPREHESYLPKGTRIDDYLMQWTGLTNASTCKIFEGDIVDYHGIHVCGVVTWVDENAGFKVISHQKAYTLHDGWEVIGNIHENSDLLTA